MAAGFRGLLAFWAGGAAQGLAPTVQAGVRGMLAPWIGGAGKGSAPPVATPGFRGLLGFWIGGAGRGGVVPPVSVPVAGGGGGGTSSWEIGRNAKWLEYTREKQRRYDEVFAKLLKAELAYEAAKIAIAANSSAHAYTAKERLRLRPLVERVEKLKVQLAKLETDLDEEHLMITLMLVH